jgi:pyruvate dehydrogenase E1 component alpha subunit
MPGTRIDGNLVLGVLDAVAEAAERARGGEGPTLIEAMTYRHKGHSRSDPATYRPEGELEQWLERDPILLHERALGEAGVEPERLGEVRVSAQAAVAEALEQALAWPDPALADRFEDVWA